MDYVLSTENLSKQYKNFKALNRLSMHVEKGAIYGFIGKNGAGKTTLIRLICGLQNPTSGEYTIYGEKYTSPNILKVRPVVVSYHFLVSDCHKNLRDTV